MAKVIKEKEKGPKFFPPNLKKEKRKGNQGQTAGCSGRSKEGKGERVVVQPFIKF